MVTEHPELPAGGGWLFAEVTGCDGGGGGSRSRSEVARTAGVPHRIVTDTLEQLALWRIREDGAGLAARSLSRPAQAGWEDAAVPPAKLGAYLRDFDALLKQSRLDGVPYGHFGDGCVHVRIDFELEDAGGRGGTASSSSRPPTWWRRTAARCPVSTATAGPARSCSRGCTPRRRSP